MKANTIRKHIGQKNGALCTFGSRAKVDLRPAFQFKIIWAQRNGVTRAWDLAFVAPGTERPTYSNRVSEERLR
jgi:hypothetical protein